MTTIYKEARRCLESKHMIYSSHEYKKIIAGLLAAVDSGKCKCEPIRPEKNTAPS